jgi:Holliday junction resolvase RusA-like endonuclease
VALKFYVKPPKATPKWKIPYMDREYIRPNKSPDLDNFTKLTLDALNGILWEDDRYIVEIHASKFYTSEKPRTEIILDQLPDFTSKKEVEKAISEYKNSLKIDEFFDIEE